MIRVGRIFSVSIFAILAVGAANAAIVSDTYIASQNNAGLVKSGGDITVGTDGAVTVNSATKADSADSVAAANVSGLAKVATSGSYNDLSNKPTIGSANLTIQKNGTTIDTFSANATAAKTINVTVPTKVSELSNDSGYATTDAVNAKVSTNQGTANAGKGLVVDATTGNLTLTDVATQAELNTVSNTANGKQAKSTADYQIGNKSGTWTTMSSDQQNALNSGATSAKINAIATNTSNLSSHTGNADIHVTAAQKTAWSGKQDALTDAQKNAVNSGITSTKVSTYDAYATNKVSVSQGTANAGKGLVVDATTGNLTLTDVATQAELNTVSNTANGKQAKSTADYQIGNKSGTWTTMSSDQQNALNSGATSAKINAIATNTSNLSSHTGNADIHVTAAQKTAWSGKQDKLTFDTAPTASSTNPVTSGGVASALSGKQDKSTAVTHSANTAVGGESRPVYVNASGVATAVTKVAATYLADATPTDDGVAKLGEIPMKSNGAWASTTATIWVE